MLQVDCITVSTTPVKAVIDDHIQRLFDALLNSLRRSITKDVGTIETFLNDAMDTLSQRPQTVEEIGEANAKHSEFGKSKKEVSGSLNFFVCIKIKAVAIQDFPDWGTKSQSGCANILFCNFLPKTA